MIFSLLTLTTAPSTRWSSETLRTYFDSLLSITFISFYYCQFILNFLNIHIFQMENFNWLLKKLMKIIELLIVFEEEIFQICFSKFWTWLTAKARGSCCLYFQPPGFALAVSSAWNALPSALCMVGFFSLLKSTGMSFSQRSFLWEPF